HPQEELNSLLPFASLCLLYDLKPANAYKCFAEDYQKEHRRRAFSARLHKASTERTNAYKCFAEDLQTSCREMDYNTPFYRDDLRLKGLGLRFVLVGRTSQ
ncbi:hypothetical protein PROFUN_09815, partial [Planoprotostelium fungivorum]